MAANPPAPASVSPPSNARAGGAGRTNSNRKHPLPLLRSVDGTAGGRGELLDRPEQLCEALLAAWEPVLGDSPAQRLRREPRARGWPPPARCSSVTRASGSTRALAYMVNDEILGSQALTMPGFAKVADQLIARAYARRAAHRDRSSTRRPARGAQQLGRGPTGARARDPAPRPRRTRGRRSTSSPAHDALFAQFVERVRWSALCERADAVRRAPLRRDLGRARRHANDHERSTPHEHDHQRPRPDQRRPAAQPRRRELGARRGAARRAPPVRGSWPTSSLRAEHFYREQYGLVFEAMLPAHERRRARSTISPSPSSSPGRSARAGRRRPRRSSELAGWVPAAGHARDTGGSCATTRSCERLLTATYEIQAQSCERTAGAERS